MADRKKLVAVIGPIYCNGGIASVVNSIIKTKELRKKNDLIIINTSNYKDSNFIGNTIIFLSSIIKYFVRILLDKPNLAHIHTSAGISFYRKAFFVLFSNFFNIKVILHIHSSNFNNFFLSSSGINKKIIDSILKKCNAVVLLCKNWEEQLRKKFVLRNTYMINNPSPINLNDIKINMEKKHSNIVNILFLGFLIKSKGIYDLIEIAEKLRDNTFSYNIIVCGKGEEEKNFLKKIKEKKVSNIKYLGWISGQEKYQLFINSDIFLLPSYKEGMPMVILEAMSFGLPIISTKVGGIPEMVIEDENGFLLNPGDIEGFVKKIKILTLAPIKRKRFSIKSREIVRNFEKGKIALEWEFLYQMKI